MHLSWDFSSGKNWSLGCGWGCDLFGRKRSRVRREVKNDGLWWELSSRRTQPSSFHIHIHLYFQIKPCSPTHWQRSQCPQEDIINRFEFSSCLMVENSLVMTVLFSSRSSTAFLCFSFVQLQHDLLGSLEWISKGSLTKMAFYFGKICGLWTVTEWNYMNGRNDIPPPCCRAGVERLWTPFGMRKCKERY